MSQPIPSSDELLAQVIGGERTIDDPVVIDRCDIDSAFATSLHEMARVYGLLDDIGDLDREAELAMAADVRDRDADFVNDVLSGLQLPTSAGRPAVPPSPAHRSRFRVVVLAVVAAAAAALLVLAWPRGSSMEDPVPRGLLSVDERVISPSGVVDAFGDLVIDDNSLQGLLDVVVTVHDFATDEEIVRRPWRGEGEWLFDSREIEDLEAAGHVRVRVAGRTRSGEPVDFSSEARLR